MSADTISIMGIFESENQAADAIERLRDTFWTAERVYSPVPSHEIDGALYHPKSRVGWFTLVGGIVGFFSGFFLAAFTATRWSLMVSGKPVVALVPFFIVGFEFTILFAVFGNVLGLISLARLPRFGKDPNFDWRFTGDRFGILVRCPQGEKDSLTRFFEENGAEIKVEEGAT